MSPPNEYMLAACVFSCFFPFVVTVQNNTDARIRPLSFPLQGFMRLILSIVKIGPPKFRGFLTEIAPHPNIRKLREIAYFLYNTNKSIYQRRVDAVTQSENNGACGSTGRDIISVLSE